MVGSWLHWGWGRRGTQLEGGEGQSCVPAPGRCAQEFENAAILSLVTTFLPLRLPRLPHPGPHPPAVTFDGARKLGSASLPFALVSPQAAGCVSHVLFHGVDCTNNKSFTQLSPFVVHITPLLEVLLRFGLSLP